MPTHRSASPVVSSSSFHCLGSYSKVFDTLWSLCTVSDVDLISYFYMQKSSFPTVFFLIYVLDTFSKKLDGCTRHFGCRSQRIWAGTGLKASSWEPALILPESTMPTAKGGKQSAVLPTRDASEQHNQRPLKVQWWHFYLGSNQRIGIHTDRQQVQRRQGPSTEYGRETCRRSYLQWYLLVKRKSVQAWL